jgi:CheY-like chemotaxis protein
VPAHHILIADDDDSVRALLARVCVRTYPLVHITAVTNGAEALTAFGLQPADLVITNADMPVMGGLDLIRALRAQQVTVPILMCSADATKQALALAAGATRCLLKPPRLPELQQVLLDLLPP